MQLRNGYYIADLIYVNQKQAYCPLFVLNLFTEHPN